MVAKKKDTETVEPVVETTEPVLTNTETVEPEKKKKNVYIPKTKIVRK